MSFIKRLACAFVVLISIVAATRGGETGEGLSVAVQFTSAQGKIYSSVVPKTDGMATLPVAISETQKWIVNVQKRPGEKTFSISIEDPSLLMRGAQDAPSRPMTVFSASFDVMNGKPITVLKTEQYTFDITLSVE